MNKGVSPVVAEVLLIGIAITAVSSAGIFLQGTISDLQDGAENWLLQEDTEESANIQIEAGFNQSGHLAVDLRNSGSVSIRIMDESSKPLNMYIDNKPAKWQFMSGSPYTAQKNVILDPTETIRINTTRKFPSPGQSTEVRFAGPYGARTTYVCFNEGGACER